jgi:arylsulfatase
VDGELPAGKALPIASARLAVGGLDQRTDAPSGVKSVTFTAMLDPGPTQLQSWFYDASGKEVCGAYYVYVRRK